MKEITTSQLGKMLFLNILSMKLTIFPAVLTKYCGTDGKIGILLLMLFDFSTLFLYMYLIKKFPNTKVCDIVRQGIGMVGSKIFFSLLVLFYVFKCLFIVKQAHIYIIDTLVEEMNWFAFAIPLLLLMAFVLTKPRRVVARTIEFLFFMVWISFAFTLIIPITKFKLTNIFPLMENDIWSLMSSLFIVNFITGDYFIVMLAIGRVKWEENSSKKLLTYAIAGISIVAIFYFIFYGIFGKIAINQGLAISDLPLSAVYPSTIGRLDWVSVICWVFVILMIMAVMFMLTKNCLDELLHTNNRIISISIIIGFILAGMIFLYFDLEYSIRIVTTPWFGIVSLSIQVIIPILVSIAAYRCKKLEKKESEQKEKNASSKKVEEANV